MAAFAVVMVMVMGMRRWRSVRGVSREYEELAGEGRGRWCSRTYQDVVSWIPAVTSQATCQTPTHVIVQRPATGCLAEGAMCHVLRLWLQPNRLRLVL